MKKKGKWGRLVHWDAPQKVATRRTCEVLDEDGRRCLQVGRWLIATHGNYENGDKFWYAITFCEEHAFAGINTPKEAIR